jgi:hypothetical protein
MSRSSEVGASRLAETWGSSSMSWSEGLGLPGLWNKKLGVLESPGSRFTSVAPPTIIPFTAEARRRQRNGFRQWLESWLFRRKSQILDWGVIAKSLSDRSSCIGGTPTFRVVHLSFGVPFDRVLIRGYEPSFPTQIAYQNGGSHVSAGKCSTCA